MQSERDQLEIVSQHGRSGHPLAVGLLTGAAFGIGLGMLLAPRRGSELRRTVARQAGRVIDAAGAVSGRARSVIGKAQRGRNAESAASAKDVEQIWR
jgi:gas vesicle protein